MIHFPQFGRIVTLGKRLYVFARQQIYGTRWYSGCREHVAVLRQIARLRGTYYDDGIADDQALRQFAKQIHFISLHKRDDAFRFTDSHYHDRNIRILRNARAFIPMWELYPF